MSTITTEIKNGSRVHRKDLVGVSGIVMGNPKSFSEKTIPIVTVLWDDNSQSRILINQLLPGEKGVR